MPMRAICAGLVLLGLLGCRGEPETGALAADTADRELHRFLNAIPNGREADFGFRDRAELERATVGEPLRMAVPDLDGQPVPLDIWRVPVIVDGEYRALITTRLRDGEMRCAEIGAAGLATELGELEERRNARTLLRVPRHGADFVLDQDRAWPLRSARRAFRLADMPLSLVELRPMVRR